MPDKEFSGQVAVITGGAQGLGHAISALLAQRGASVAILDRDSGRLDDSVAQLARDGATARGYVTDVAREEEILQARDAILGEFGRADVLINNAGWFPFTTVQAITANEWQRVFDVNAKSVFLATRAFMDGMVARRYGRVVNIASSGAYVANLTLPHYAAAKAAVLSLTKSFALELAPHGVLVNGVSPGNVATERQRDQPWLVERLPIIPVRRAAEPRDIAEVVLFLASRRNRFVVGETIIADGGMRMY
ncbi:MAG: SDR family NAD(P)-dependent oxidoreductase [Alphaproteobacteria bacterium]